jgi:ABC-type phosphate transport system substrate-binding protein
MSKYLVTRLVALGWVVGALATGQVALANVANDSFRSGGCSGCFNAQVNAALATFGQVTRVTRGCATGGTIPNNDDCDGGLGTGGDLMDFVVLEGNLRNSNTDPNGLGVPGGAAGVLYRVSASGSSNGIRCANSANPQPIGFLATEGFDGIAGNGDDAVNGGGAGGDGTLGTADDTRAALTSCDTSVGDVGDEFEFPAGTTKAAGFSERCVVQWDLDSDRQIDNDRIGVVPGSQSMVRPNGTNETFNLSLQCDTGYADLPTSDFISPSLNTQSFADSIVQGAQIFKFVVSNDVHAVGNASKKVALNDAQVENLFTSGSQSICNWADIGADADTSNDNVNICVRDPGSGTKETFRNTFLLNAGGSRPEAVGTSTGTAGSCLQQVEAATPGGSPTNRSSSKTVFSLGGNGDVVNCVESRQGAIGYVDLADDSANSYSAIFEGVDPDTNDVKTLVKCGHYRWWGPLAGGRPNNPGLSDRGNVTPTASETAHRFALSSVAAFVAFDSYLPFGNATFGGVAIRKNVTDGSYSLSFAPRNCPAQPNPPGNI